MRLLLRGVLGVLVLSAALVLLAPAALLDGWVATRTGDRLHLVDPTGFWWRGSGVLATSDGTARVPLAWRVAFMPLLARTLRIELRTPGDSTLPAGTLALGDETLDVRDLRAGVPAALVSALVPALKPVVLRGDIEVHAPSFAWRHGRASGTLNLVWQRAGLVAVLPVDLGRVTADVAPTQDGFAGTVRNVGGDVAVDGTLAAHGGVVDVALTLTPTSRASEALRTTLPLLGHADAAGRVQVAWRSDRR